MTRMQRLSRNAVVLALLSVAPSFAVQRPGDGQTKQVESVGPWAYKRLDRAHKTLDDEQYDEALATLDEMKANPTLNDHERALMWQTFGDGYSARDEYAPAAAAFEKCIATGGLAEQAAIQTRYNLAQLDVLLQRPEQAIQQFQYWFQHVRNPAPSAFYMLAMAYVQQGDHEQALRGRRNAR